MSTVARAFVIVVIVVIGLAITPGSAWSGGYDWLETTGGRHLAIGDTAEARATFSASVDWQSGSVADGPFQVYLLPGDRGLDRGAIPRSAVPIGTLDVVERGDWNDLASVRFTVPDVAPGAYTLDYCNDPCTIDGLGSLERTSVWIGRTQLEARLLEDVTRLRERISSQADLVERGRDYEEVFASRRRLAERLTEAEAALAAAEGRTREPRATGGSDGAPWILLAGAFGLGVAVAVIARRVRLRPSRLRSAARPRAAAR